MESVGGYGDLPEVVGLHGGHYGHQSRQQPGVGGSCARISFGLTLHGRERSLRTVTRHLLIRIKNKPQGTEAYLVGSFDQTNGRNDFTGQ